MAKTRPDPKLWEKLKLLAREKRAAPTPAEDVLWQRLRRHQIGAHFRRQHAIERFIVDFCCSETQLVIEVDGSIHAYTAEEDAIRQDYLEHLGFRVVRFSNDEVLKQPDQVVDCIRAILELE